MPFSIRPSSRRPVYKPKNNEKIPFVNNQNISVESGDSKNKIDQTKLGNVGDISTLAYLYCDLQNWGKTIIRQGHREGLPLTGPQTWVFCPLMRKKNPRDRILVEQCKKCPHFKGMNEPVIQKSSDITTNYRINYVPAKKRQPKTSFSKEQIEKAIKEGEKLKREEDRKWKKEEGEIFGKNS